ncbi:MAG TPA: S8 family peptidase, partial [Herpetosiphonaceae bacterium]|nr:S8 family peptidase [Herpetosiphonaceae bacterium]
MKRFTPALCLVFVFALLAVAMPNSSFAQKTKPVEATSGRVIGESPSVPGQFIVKFKSGTQRANRQAELRSIGGAVISRVESLDSDVVEFAALKQSPSPQARAAVLDALKKNPNIEYAEPNYIYSIQYTPNDPNLNQQWAWNKIQAPRAWDVTRGSSSVVIAVVDTGIQANHPDLDAKVLAGYDYVDNDSNPADGNGHGTHVAGTAAAETNNGTGVAGTCPDCKVMPVRVLDNNGSGSLDNIARGITYAADNGAKVINLSLGGTSGTSSLESAINYAWNKGVFIACAAGNSNTTSMFYPAGYGNCMAVASTTSSDARSSFSNYGNWVDIAAPGSDIYSTFTGSSYKSMNGTSMASPHVAGLAGLLASQGLTNSQIRSRLCSTADQISGTGSAWSCGRINAAS